MNLCLFVVAWKSLPRRISVVREGTRGLYSPSPSSIFGHQYEDSWVKSFAQRNPCSNRFHDGISNRCQPCVQLLQGPPADHRVTLFLIADAAAGRFVECQQQVECDVRRLEILHIRVADVVHQGTEGGRAWRRDGL